MKAIGVREVLLFGGLSLFSVGIGFILSWPFGVSSAGLVLMLVAVFGVS